MYIPHDEKVLGVWFVGISAAILGFILFFWWRKKKEGLITVYRDYEELLIRNGKLKLEDYMTYITKWSFSTYAALSIGMVLVTVTLLLLEKTKFYGWDAYIVYVILGFLSTSTVAFVCADYVHTNSQTPIIPVERRFKLVDISITLYQIGIYGILYAILLYISLINVWVTGISSGVVLIISLYSQKQRSLPKTEFFKYHGVTDPKGWEKGDDKYIKESESLERVTPKSEIT